MFIYKIQVNPIDTILKYAIDYDFIDRILYYVYIYMYLVILYMILSYLWSCDVYNNNPIEYNKSQFLPFYKSIEKKKEIVPIR